MERTNENLESYLLAKRNVALSWQSHADEWDMSIDTYSGVLRSIANLYDRERKAAYQMFKAAQAVLESIGENATDEHRNALAESLYVYSRIMGETSCCQATQNFERYGGKLMFKHRDAEYHGEVVTMTLQELLTYINADRNPEWLDYDSDDWEEGMREWTDLEIVKW